MVIAAGIVFIIGFPVISPEIISAQEPAGVPELRVLFIGNSYTYFNNLPGILAGLAADGGRGRVETRMVAPGGWRLKDQWEKGQALEALRSGRWDYVVLQDQSTLGLTYFLDGKARIAGDAVFRPFAEKWSAEILRKGAIPLFYMTWARQATPEDQAALAAAYFNAARAGRAQVAPVGLAWDRIRREAPPIDLFFTDGSHPSAAGSYLAACVFYAVIFKQSPVGLTNKVSGVPVDLDSEKEQPGKIAVLAELPAEEARTLQAAAWETVRSMETEETRRPIPPPPVPEPLDAGLPLDTVGLEGPWSGELAFYPAPFLPAGMILDLRREGPTWKGRLQLLFHSKEQADQSLELTDLAARGAELTFSDPEAPQKLAIRFRGVSPRAGELRGIAEALAGSSESPIRLLGTWRLRKK
jgi:hypothetical protein